jgi:WD40 repeat protein
MEHPEATHLFFIDADIEFDPNDLLRMVAYDKPVTVGAYPKKAVNWDSIIDAVKRNPEETAQTVEGHSSNYVVNFDFLKDEKGNITPQIQIRDNLIKLKDAGTGFMCIKKEVIQQMFDNHPELSYANDINVDQKYEKHMFALFDTMIDPDSRRYLSEDYTFCRLWQNMGGDVYLDPRTALNHVGHYTFRGNIRKLITG